MATKGFKVGAAIGAGLGIIAAVASLGANLTIPDVLIGCVTGALIGGGLGAANKETAGMTSKPGRPTTQTFQIYEFEVSEEMKKFLLSLPVLQGRLNGWFKDPAGLFLLRYFYNGQWTLAVSDSESEHEKSAALASLRPASKPLNEMTGLTADAYRDPSASDPGAGESTLTGSPPNTPLLAPSPIKTDLVSQLERLASLRNSGALTEIEFQQAKRHLLD